VASLTVNIHASTVRLGRAGAVFGAPKNFSVLLLGRPGAGKSDLALRLLARGAELVADDRTDLYVSRGRLMASAPAAIAGLMEVRALGIVALPFAAKVPVGLAVRLDSKPKRLPELEFWRPPAALALKPKAFPPVISLNPFEASAPEKVLIAAAAFAKGLHRDQVNAI
jgi:Serine kinase of the HPr protein, regulates carbohydrate metabolism